MLHENKIMHPTWDLNPEPQDTIRFMRRSLALYPIEPAGLKYVWGLSSINKINDNPNIPKNIIVSIKFVVNIKNEK